MSSEDTTLAERAGRLIRTGISAGTLKKIAAITMLIDHVTCCFLERVYIDGVPLWKTGPFWHYLDLAGRGVGRIAFPIFCFMILEGYSHTSSKVRYLFRLVLFGLVSHYPFNWIFFPGSKYPHTGTMFTLALGLLSVWVLDAMLKAFPPVSDPKGKGTGNRWLNLLITVSVSGPAVFVFCRAAELIGSDYGYGGVMTIVIMYLLRQSRDLQAILGWAWLAFYNSYELYAIPGFFLIRCYNGTRGKQSKYFFYIFYPAHLLILYLIRKSIFGL